MDNWQQFATALALVFVIEGMLPFLAPRHWRDMVRQVSTLSDKGLRNVGLGSMLFGLALLYWVR
ncbi:MAG: DUF2065 domain-containing protein [Pseudomonadota bacterium]